MVRGRKSKLANVQLIYKCDWRDCMDSFLELDQLKLHQLEHFRVLCIQASEGLIEPVCGVCNITLNIGNLDAIERHSFFHSWIRQLRTQGEQLQLINDWPTCLSDSSLCNQVPDLPTKFECGWQYCDFNTNDVSVFISHVSKHPEEYTDSRYPRGTPLRCLWDDCTYVARRLRNLTSHLDTHTQKKRAACPTCGLLLVDYSKLEDHLKRQQIHLLNSSSNHTAQLHHSISPMKCSRCHRVFSTKKLLATHMKRHINTVKCPLCDMTSFGKSGLDRHMLFRHSDIRPFQCPYCPDSFKISGGLTRHIQYKHSKNMNNDVEPSAILPTNTEDSHLSTIQTSSSVPVHGPLAQAGALRIINPTATHPTGTGGGQSWKAHLNPTNSLVCPHTGCGFKTTKHSGYLIHIGRKHNPISVQYTDNRSLLESLYNSDDSQPPDSHTRLYICHMCSVVKRRGSELSKHLMKDHHLARPSGHVRFTYTISDDGHYRLQLTRLDTVPVATELLGETVVSKLLYETQKQVTTL